MRRLASASVVSVLLAGCGSSAPPPAPVNRLLLGGESRAPGVRPIALHPPMCLNGLTREEVFELRRSQVRAHAELAAPGYEPGAPFAAIQDRRPWWGADGFDHYWTGMRSIEGLSIQSPYVANPFLLVGLGEWWVLWNVDSPGEGPPRLLPTRLDWNASFARAEAHYAVGPYFDYLSRFPSYDRTLDLVAYNAEDFGLKYLWVDDERSTGVAWRSPDGRPVRIPQYIHCGGSCGYPGGCNNMSPTSGPTFLVDVKDLPAKLVVKLWRRPPDFAAEAADMTFVIDLDR